VGRTGRGSLVVTNEEFDLPQVVILQSFCHQYQRSRILTEREADLESARLSYCSRYQRGGNEVKWQQSSRASQFIETWDILTPAGHQGRAFVRRDEPGRFRAPARRLGGNPGNRHLHDGCSSPGDLFDAKVASRPTAEQIIAVAMGAPPGRTDSPFLRLWESVVKRSAAAYGPYWERFVREGLSGWARVSDAKELRPKRIDDFPSYLTLRRIDFGIDTIPVSLEYAAGIDLSDLRGDRHFEAFHQAVSNQAVLVNDLMSFRNEYCTGKQMNALFVLQRHAGLSLQESANMACREVAAAEDEFFSCASRLLESHPERRKELGRYIEKWHLVLGGHMAWEFSSTRYHGEDHVWDGSVPERITITPDRTLFCSAPVSRHI
jgi:hypothetical protein